MDLTRRTLVAAPVGALAASALPAAPAPRAPRPDARFDLWPGEAPGLLAADLRERVTERSTDARFNDRALDRIRSPRLEVFRAARPNGAAMLVIPGGGYQRVVVDKEGYELAPWLAARGITAFVLFYRLPAEGWRNASNVPLADAQRAMRLIRQGARRWGIDPSRVGAMGFSAGGHLCADLATRSARDLYQPVDGADALDPRPLLAAPIYPVISMDPRIAHGGSRDQLVGVRPSEALIAEHSPDRQVSATTPPCFLAHAEDDATVPVANTLALRAALKSAGVPVETHLFERGGHGFGYGRRTAGLPADRWPDLWLDWARGKGLLGSAA